MKRFLKQDRYQLDDLEREQVWQGIRRDLKSGRRRSLFQAVSLRPAVAAGFTMAILAALGVWWIASDQALSLIHI